MKASLTQTLIGSSWLSPGVIVHPDGSISKGFETEPLSGGTMEEAFDGDIAAGYFAKLADLLTKMPNAFEGQMLLCRRELAEAGVPGFETKLFCFERVPKADSYSHFKALLTEANLGPEPLELTGWRKILAGLFGESVLTGKMPDVTWGQDCLNASGRSIRALFRQPLNSVQLDRDDSRRNFS